ncbi:hypothetical protein [Brevibacillus agri]|uniref:hypothetical protein n=1 Tax=Brevibacillus agri TaxID=51101 RepID=UPI0012DC3E42|nr:hypothetical protein [Brevibacillus agri]
MSITMLATLLYPTLDAASNPQILDSFQGTGEQPDGGHPPALFLAQKGRPSLLLRSVSKSPFCIVLADHAERPARFFSFSSGQNGAMLHARSGTACGVSGMKLLFFENEIHYHHSDCSEKKKVLQPSLVEKLSLIARPALQPKATAHLLDSLASLTASAITKSPHTPLFRARECVARLL